jgi:hypothetical protein
VIAQFYLEEVSNQTRRKDHHLWKELKSKLNNNLLKNLKIQMNKIMKNLKIWTSWSNFWKIKLNKKISLFSILKRKHRIYKRIWITTKYS